MVGYSPQSCKESDITEHTHTYIYPLFFRFFFHIGHYRILSRVPTKMSFKGKENYLMCDTEYKVITIQRFKGSVGKGGL